MILRRNGKLSDSKVIASINDKEVRFLPSLKVSIFFNSNKVFVCEMKNGFLMPIYI